MFGVLNRKKTPVKSLPKYNQLVFCEESVLWEKNTGNLNYIRNTTVWIRNLVHDQLACHLFISTGKSLQKKLY